MEKLAPMNFAGCSPLRSRGVVLAGISTVRGCDAPIGLNANHHQLVYTIRGEGVLSSIGGVRRLKKNELWVVPAVPPYSLRCAGRVWETMWFSLRKNVRWRFLETFAPHRRFAGQSFRMVHVLTGLIAEVTSPCEDRVQMGKLFAEVLGIFLDRRLHQKGEAKSNNLRNRLAELWEEVDADLAAAWTVTDFARGIHVSVPHLHRLVLQYHSTSPMKLLARLRLQRAAELLKHTDLKLDAIASAVGYQSAFSLSKAFGREMRVPPSKFRKQSI